MDKCELFQNIAAKVWDEIVKNHRRGNRLIEEGITRSSIIDGIQDYVENHHNFNVFAQKSKNEVTTGSDLEVYLQIGHNQFTRILLQAKIVDLDGAFHDLNRFSGSTKRRQYDSLIDYSKTINSTSFYILYNGIPNFNCIENDCLGEHNEKQYGCVLVSPIWIKKYCEKNKTGRLVGNTIKNKPIGIPWRVLTCCAHFAKEISTSKFIVKMRLKWILILIIFSQNHFQISLDF